MVKVKVEVYRPVSSASAALPTFHNYSLVTARTVFVYKPSQLPREHTAW